MSSYKNLNNSNRAKAKDAMNINISFKWEDEELLNALIGHFDMFYFYGYEINTAYKKELNEYENVINLKIKEFNNRFLSAKEFIKFCEDIMRDMEKKYQYQYVDRFNLYIRKAHIFQKVLIYGIGGIGKSRFIYEFEKILRNKKIEHLCIYGKFQKSLSNDIIAEIKNIAKSQEFVLAFDAINELDSPDREIIYKQILDLTKSTNMRIIVTYRKNTLNDIEEDKWNKLFKNTYLFQGVDYEYSMEILMERFSVNALKYHEIVATNNPQFILMLDNLLKNSKISENNIGGITQFTFLYEKYIKKFCSQNEWKITKKIADYMFNNCTRGIEEKILKEIVGCAFESYINKMAQQDLINFYDYDNKRYFIFTVEILSNYLISRSFFRAINSSMKPSKIIELINNKLESGLYGIDEPIIIALFDIFKNDINKALDIIRDSRLNDNFEMEYLRYIVFKNEEAIQIAKERFKINRDNIKFLFWTFAGHIRQPFNATNYCSEYLLNNKPEQLTLFTDNYNESELILRCKNAIYLINMIDCSNEYIEEFFWLSIWCTCSKNTYLRANAEKLLFDIVDNNIFYIKKLINIYPNIADDYIRESIVETLANVASDYDNIVNGFLESIYKDEDEINAHIIMCIDRRIYKFGNYINRSCKNIYILSKDIVPSDKFNRVLFIAECYFRHFLPSFYVNGESCKMSLSNKLFLADKNEIKQWNRVIDDKYACVKIGDCLGSPSIKQAIEQRIKPNFSLELISDRSTFLCFQYIWEKVARKYKYVYNDDFKYGSNPSNSMFKKVLTIAKNLFYGSLICNYYTDNFESFNGDFDMIGYTPFYPTGYYEAPVFLSPISIYSPSIEKLNDELVSIISDNSIRDEKWANDREDTINKVKKLTSSVFYNKYEWKLLSGDINLRSFDSNSEMITNECYVFSLSYNPTKRLAGGEEDKYLTIEHNSYEGNIKDYGLYNNCFVMNIKNNNKLKNESLSSTLVFPPSNIINLLKLKFNVITTSWDNADGETVILCDNNKYNYYRSNLINAVYIRKDYYNKLVKDGSIVYFIFTERFKKDMGFSRKTSLHIEFDLDGLVKIFENYKPIRINETINLRCLECKIYADNQKKISYESALLELDCFLQDFIDNED